jgi:hypothetical protein
VYVIVGGSQSAWLESWKAGKLESWKAGLQRSKQLNHKTRVDARCERRIRD